MTFSQAGFEFYFLSVHLKLLSQTLFHLIVTGPDKLRSNSPSRIKLELFTLDLLKVHEICLTKQNAPKFLLDIQKKR